MRPRRRRLARQRRRVKQANAERLSFLRWAHDLIERSEAVCRLLEWVLEVSPGAHPVYRALQMSSLNEQRIRIAVVRARMTMS